MLKVLKFGGTSVGTLDRIQNVANIIKKIKDEGHDVIAIVSAMSGETNRNPYSKENGKYFDGAISQCF